MTRLGKIGRLMLAAGVALMAVTSCDAERRGARGFDDVPSLRAIWAGHFPLGNIAASVDYSWRPARVRDIGNPERERLLARHFDIVTAEDEMKPDWLRPTPGAFNASGADAIVNFARANGLRVHGHTLVWHSQSPWWLNLASAPPAGWTYSSAEPATLPREQAIANMQSHIEMVMRHFGDSVESWDVLNEVFQSSVNFPVRQDNWRSALRDAPWLRAIGSDPDGDCFIWIAFTTARRVADEINPGMVLYYNDYNEEQPNKRDAIYHMVREMNERFARENDGRRLIDAIGMQAHYHRGHVDHGDARFPWGPVNVDNVRAAIEHFASLGVYVSITELDVTVGHTGLRPLTPEQEREQAILFARLFQVFRDNSRHIRRVSIWGLNDSASWRSEGSPLLFGEDFRPKEAFWAVANPDAFLADADAFLANPRAFLDSRYW